MRIKRMEEKIEIPSGVTVEIAGAMVKIKGPKGELSREFRHPNVKIGHKDDSIIISADDASKREKTMIGSFNAHVKNMIIGVTQGHKYVLKICSGHFPMNVSVSGSDFILKNFLGEKVPRILSLKGGAKVRIDGQEVIVEGIDKEVAGQTAAEIEKLTTIKGRDKRIFQDGIYIINKDGKDMMK